MRHPPIESRFPAVDPTERQGSTRPISYLLTGKGFWDIFSFPCFPVNPTEAKMIEQHEQTCHRTRSFRAGHTTAMSRPLVTQLKLGSIEQMSCPTARENLGPPGLNEPTL